MTSKESSHQENTREPEEQSKKEANNDQNNVAAAEKQAQAASKAPERTPKQVTITDIELEKLKNELAESKDKYLRVLAESENARKRLQKEKQEMIQYAQQSLIIDFLNPIDHMENALKFTQQMSNEVKHWAIGFQMILSQFKDVLTSTGVTPFASEGKPFDPHRHEAIESVSSEDFPPGTVIEECLKGYLMGDKVIRPARVKVSKAPQKEASKTEP